jgi:hypothetical protein
VLTRERPAADHPQPASRFASLALTVLTLLGAGCSSQPDGVEQAAAGDGSAPDPAVAVDRPVVEVPTGDGWGPFLDPDAEPSTDLGRLRAQHLPVWTSDFDWAFPPDVCNSAWELDAIAEPAPGADVLAMGDFATAAALTVMRYEHQLSRALAEPSALSQLCVAAATVEPARTDDLTVLASYLATGVRRSQPAAYPDEVWILGVSPTAAVSVACVTPGYPAVVGAEGETVEPAQSPARLQAYLLSVSQGLEDQVADISYRVSNAAHRPAEDCEGLDAWALEWNSHVQTWINEGQIWEPLGAILTAEEICDSPPPDGPDECPQDWPQ